MSKKQSNTALDIDPNIGTELRQRVPEALRSALQQLVARLSDTVATLLDELFVVPLYRAALVSAMKASSEAGMQADGALLLQRRSGGSDDGEPLAESAHPSERELSELRNFRLMLGVLLANRANAQLRLVAPGAALDDIGIALSLEPEPAAAVPLVHLRAMAHAVNARRDAAELDRRSLANSPASREAADAVGHFLRFVTTARPVEYYTPEQFQSIRLEAFVNNLPPFEELPSPMSGDVPLLDRAAFARTYERLARVHVALGKPLPRCPPRPDAGAERVGSFMRHLYDSHNARIRAMAADPPSLAVVPPLVHANPHASHALLRAGLAAPPTLEPCADATDAKVRGNRALAKNDARLALAYYTLALTLDATMRGAQQGRRRALQQLGIVDELAGSNNDHNSNGSS